MYYLQDFNDELEQAAEEKLSILAGKKELEGRDEEMASRIADMKVISLIGFCEQLIRMTII